MTGRISDEYSTCLAKKTVESDPVSRNAACIIPRRPVGGFTAARSHVKPFRHFGVRPSDFIGLRFSDFGFVHVPSFVFSWRIHEEDWIHSVLVRGRRFWRGRLRRAVL